MDIQTIKEQYHLVRVVDDEGKAICIKVGYQSGLNNIITIHIWNELENPNMKKVIKIRKVN